MCLILFKYQSHPRYKLVLAANRDEFYARLTQPMKWWQDKEGVLAGRDGEKQGAWLGVNKNGRFAAVTNYRKLPVEGTFETSRGALVTDFISAETGADDYLDKLIRDRDLYDGYNLIFGTAADLYYYSNRGNDSGSIVSGTHGLSNHLMNTPWPKVVRGKRRLEKLTSQDRVDPDLLIEMMRNADPADDPDLPDTGVGLELERVLSAGFIESPVYGTRCTTVLLVDRDNQVTILERSYVPEAVNKYEFKIQ